MSVARSRWLWVLWGVALAQFPANAEIPRGNELLARTYDPQGLLGKRIAAAGHAADAILRGAGVSLQWQHCDLPGQGLDADRGVCRLPVAANHLVIRLVAAPAAAAPQALGFTYLDRSPNRSWLATVFVDRLFALADRTRLPPEVLVGRAMAHELGHLLLETSAHEKQGFMQASWSDGMLRRNRPSDWLFTPRHAKLIRTGALVRGRAPTTDALALRGE
jgi:hypothetical protein